MLHSLFVNRSDSLDQLTVDQGPSVILFEIKPEWLPYVKLLLKCVLRARNGRRQLSLWHFTTLSKMQRVLAYCFRFFELKRLAGQITDWNETRVVWTTTTIQYAQKKKNSTSPVYLNDWTTPYLASRTLARLISFVNSRDVFLVKYRLVCLKPKILIPTVKLRYILLCWFFVNIIDLRKLLSIIPKRTHIVYNACRTTAEQCPLPVCTSRVSILMLTFARVWNQLL